MLLPWAGTMSSFKVSYGVPEVICRAQRSRGIFASQSLDKSQTVSVTELATRLQSF